VIANPQLHRRPIEGGSEAIAVTPLRPGATAVANFLVPAATSLAAFVLVIACFAPRFVLWPFVDLESAEVHPPEFNRAIDSLRQLDNPFVPITNPKNRVINWRLIFPVIGHYLHLPHWAYLSLPTLGCLVVLAYVAHLVRRESGTWWSALAASALCGSTSWFFVSTGWLAYFDSWCVLGMLVAAFGRSKLATGLACLLTPWVDERFLLTLPLLVVVRAIYSGETAKRSLSDALRFSSLVAPYCALRFIALVTEQDQGSTVHLREHLATVHSAREIALGMWSGLRALWAFVAIAPVLLFRKGRVAGAAILLVAIAGTLLASVPLAHDLSRTTSTLVPPAVLGIILLVRLRPSLAGWPIAVALAFNLLMPAQHIVEGWEHPGHINPLHVEIALFRHPPRLMAGLHLTRAGALAVRGRLSAALAEAEEALLINPTSASAHLSRGMILTDLGRLREASADYDAAVRLAPQQSDVFIFRARFRRAQRQPAAAEQDYQSALNLMPEGSPDRVALKNEVAKMLGRSGAP
jgi:hypothetical protein